MTSFRRWQPEVRKERQTPNTQLKEIAEKEEGREESGGGQTDKSSSSGGGSVLARNVKQFSWASRLLS